MTSLVNARNTRGASHELVVEELLEQWPETPQQLAEIRLRAWIIRLSQHERDRRHHPFARNGQAAHRRLRHPLENSGVAAEEWQTALRYQGDFLHERLHLIALLSAFGEQLDQGGFTRLTAAYDLADALTITGGVISYEGGKKFPFDTLADNDRLFIDVKYSF